ncbi:MAG: 50S ribosome-binding GTPase [Candidatus Sericytochromatia bacterium]|nr:50S ribosome-binding GTPase [Candidatus Tanganyikabacteria bacterium]
MGASWRTERDALTYGDGTGDPLWVVVGPSGSGKTTLVEALVRSGPGLVRAVTCTTRPPRQGERDGLDYCFRSEEAFSAMMAAGELVEHTRYGGYRYGLPWASLGDGREAVIVVVDPPGVANLRGGLGRPMVVLGLAGPGEAELRRRLTGRGDAEADIRTRLALARDEAEAIRACADVLLPSLAPEALRVAVERVMQERRAHR